MELEAHHIEVLKRVRERFQRPLVWNNYICIMAAEECEMACERELERWYNKVFFWRRFGIRNKWSARSQLLVIAIRWALRGEPTLGQWFENKTRSYKINVREGARHNKYLYKQMRLAWLDRIIEMEEIK